MTMDCNAAKSAAQKMFPNAKCEASYCHAESTNGFSTSNYTTYEVAVVFEENRTSQHHNEPLSITNKSEDSFELCLLSLKVAVFEKQAKILDELRYRVERDANEAMERLRKSEELFAKAQERHSQLLAEMKSKPIS